MHTVPRVVLAFCASALAGFCLVRSEVALGGRLLAPVVGFSNMEQGWHVTEKGYRAIVKEGGKIVAAGYMSIDAVIKGQRDDAAQGSPMTRVTLDIDMKYLAPEYASGAASGQKSGTLSLCMAETATMPLEESRCKQLESRIGGEVVNRPFQYIDTPIDFTVANGELKITRYNGETGSEGSPEAIAVSLHHPAYGVFAPQKSFKDYQSPLVLDLDHDGALDLVDVWDDSKPVRFDVEGDGTVQRTGWVQPQDGLLVYDANGNGKIDDGRELFSEFSDGKRFANGFQSLARFDANADGVVDAKDPKFADLRVWRDLNGDGESQPKELLTLAEAGVLALDLAYTTTSHTGAYPLVAGNEVRLVSSYRATDGKSYPLSDVWFKQRRFALEARK